MCILCFNCWCGGPWSRGEFCFSCCRSNKQTSPGVTSGGGNDYGNGTGMELGGYDYGDGGVGDGGGGDGGGGDGGGGGGD